MAAPQRPAAPPGGALSILPDDVLTRCLEGLTQEERCGRRRRRRRAPPGRLLSPVASHFPLCFSCRLRSVSLVSKRFHRLCTGPQLLRNLRLRCVGLAAVESLAQFVCKHARHLRTLHATFMRGPEPLADLAAAITAAVTAAGAAGQLQELTVVSGWNSELPEPTGWTPLPTAWLPAVSTLRRLEISIYSPSDPLRIASGILCLTALESLELNGHFVFGAGVALPTSITCLELQSADPHEVTMPAQVSPSTFPGNVPQAPPCMLLLLLPGTKSPR